MLPTRKRRFPLECPDLNREYEQTQSEASIFIFLNENLKNKKRFRLWILPSAIGRLLKGKIIGSLKGEEGGKETGMEGRGREEKGWKRQGNKERKGGREKRGEFRNPLKTLPTSEI